MPEITWCNHKLPFNGTLLAYKYWAKSGINMINDIIKNTILIEGDIYYNNNLVVKAGFYFELFTLKCCILSEWMNKLLIWICDINNETTYFRCNE